MIHENIKAIGLVTITVNRYDGTEERVGENLVVSTGLAHIIARMQSDSAAVQSHTAIGSGTAVPAGANTTLANELGRVAISSITTEDTNVTGDSVQYTATFPAGVGTGAITEAGLFNAAAGGTMLSRISFAVINKGALDSITITWKITIA